MEHPFIHPECGNGSGCYEFDESFAQHQLKYGDRNGYAAAFYADERPVKFYCMPLLG